MKKNLLYYSIGVNDEYAEMVKMSLKSISISNKKKTDILIITDKEYYNKNLVDIIDDNLFFLFMEFPKEGDQKYFNRLKVFDFPRISEYENVLYLDSDILVNIDLNYVFDKCEHHGTLYTVIEDPDYDNHKRIQFGLGNYTEEELHFFRNNNIHTFNSGTLLFKSSPLMKKHFNNVLSMIQNHSGNYFTDQSFLNYYFNTYNLSNTSKIVKFEDLIYVVDSNYSSEIKYENKLLHFITESNASIGKKEKMKTILDKLEGKNYGDRSLWIKNISKYIGNGKGVEVGVFKGDFSKQILQSWEGTLYMVDVWKGLGEEYIDISNHNFHTEAYKETMDNISGFEDRGIMIRASSKVASEMFEDESLDFVFIDANHAYDFVVEDIKLWYPKLKKGGMFSGHDYILMDWYNDPNFAPNNKDKYIYTFTDEGQQIYNGIFGVNPAVDEFCERMGYKVNHTGEWFSTWWVIQ